MIKNNIENVLHVKNMVCQRCINSVVAIFEDLKIEILSISLGEVILKEKIEGNKKVKLINKLEEIGFELLEDNKSKLISQIKSIIISQVHYNDEHLNYNYSTLLTEKLHHDYTYLSKLFSSVEGITLEHYIIKQKIEKVKELIFYKELTLSEISYQMDYSSVAHLSAQFKKETGMTPTAFKKLKTPNLSHLDCL